MQDYSAQVQPPDRWAIVVIHSRVAAQPECDLVTWLLPEERAPNSELESGPLMTPTLLRWTTPPELIAAKDIDRVSRRAR